MVHTNWRSWVERTYSTLTASDGTQASGSVVQHTNHSATQAVVERYKTGLEWDRVLTDIRDFPYPDYSKWRWERLWRWSPIFWSLLSQARRSNRTVSIETKSPKLNIALPQKSFWTEYGLICSQLPYVILTLASKLSLVLLMIVALSINLNPSVKREGE